jgi:hypothetical protein
LHGNLESPFGSQSITFFSRGIILSTYSDRNGVPKIIGTGKFSTTHADTLVSKLPTIITTIVDPHIGNFRPDALIKVGGSRPAIISAPSGTDFLDINTAPAAVSRAAVTMRNCLAPGEDAQSDTLIL